MSRLAKLSWRNHLLALALSAPLSIAGVFVVQASEDVGGSSEGTEKTVTNATVDWDAAERVRDMIAEWKASDPTAQHLMARDDLAIVEGVAWANVRTQQKRWGKSRSLAYSKAFVEAMKDYVSRNRTRHASSSLRELSQADLDEGDLVYEPGEEANDYLSRVATKALTLGERNLDTALLESGMTADEIERLTPPQKKIAFSDRILLEATTRASGSAFGLVPVKTFEAFDDEGNSAIGVVAVLSTRMRNLAQQIAARKAIRPDADRARTPIIDQIEGLSDRDLAYEFGPRVWWDEHGYPTIVAFGQWAWSPEGLDKRKKARSREFAMEQAESDAMSHLATFINVRTDFSKKSVRGEVAEEIPPHLARRHGERRRNGRNY